MDNKIDCFQVANYFIWLANETGSFISNLKLQQLVYYAQAWSLALYDTPLFEEDFEAMKFFILFGSTLTICYIQAKNK